MSAEDNDGDLAAYNTSSFLNAQSGGRRAPQSDDDPDGPPPSGFAAVWHIVKAIFLTIFGYLRYTLETFPIIAFWFTWAFIILGLCSVVTRWFVPTYFSYSSFRPFSWTSLISFVMPISLPVTWLTAAVMAYHGGRIEEMRGSSYLLCFIMLITVLTQSTVVLIRLLTPSIILDKPIGYWWFFDSYGWDYLPFSLVMLHGWLANHPYIAIFGFPLRVHMTPALYISGLIFGITHGFRISFTIPIALTITWLLKHLLLSRNYTRFTGLLFTPILCKIGGTLQRFIPWQYDPSLSDYLQLDETREMFLASQEHSYTQYVISLRTSEHYGEVQATEAILPRPLESQYAQLYFPSTNGRGHYSSTATLPLPSSSSSLSSSAAAAAATTSALPHQNSFSSTVPSFQQSPTNTPSVDFNALVSEPETGLGHIQTQSTDPGISRRYNENGEMDQRTPSNSGDELTGLAHHYHRTNTNSDNNSRRYGSEGSPLIEGRDQNCFDFEFMEPTGQRDTAQRLLTHLKFNSLIFRHHHQELDPHQVKYTTVRDRSFYSNPGTNAKPTPKQQQQQQHQV